MNCETTRSELLQLDWDEGKCRRMGSILAHLRDCESCQSAMQDFDRVRSLLAPGSDTAEPAGGFRAYEDRILHKTVGFRRRQHWAPILLAASVALAVGGWGMYLRSNLQGQEVRPAAGRKLLTLGLTPEEISDRVELFDQLGEVFDRQTGWVLISDEVSDLGIGRVAENAAKTLLLLRLSVCQDDSLLSTADLLIVPGQEAQVTVPSEHGPLLRYQISTSAEDPGRLQLRVEVEERNGRQEHLGALLSDLRMRPGQVTSAGQMVTRFGRYEVNVGAYQADLPVQQS